MISNVRGRPVLEVRVNQTSRLVLDAFNIRYGGKVMGPYSREDKPNCKPQWHWVAYAQQAEEFLEDVLQALIVKRERALLALDFRKLFKAPNVLPRGLHKDAQKVDRVLGERRAVQAQMAVLNRRGNP